MIFPVKIPFSVSPDISKYQGETFEKEINPFYISEKKKELTLHRKYICSQTNDISPLLNRFTDYCDIENVSTMEAVAMYFNEDIAILKNGIVKGICFCFPSSFIPAELVEKSFYAMHQPVPENQNLLKASDKIVELISEEHKQFRRFVWTISSLPTLSQLPIYKRPNPVSVEDLYFRTETQTTLGLGDGICAFLIKVNMTPLITIWSDLEKRKQIIDSILTMSPAIIEYKNLKKIKEILLQNQ